jgi:hypothetical protein
MLFHVRNRHCLQRLAVHEISIAGQESSLTDK